VRITTVAAVSVVLGLFFSPLTTSADVYEYSDANGTTHFTDDPAKIPKKFKKKKKVRNEDEESPGSNITRVKIVGNSVLVPVTVCYRGREAKGNFILDTGATTSTINPSFAEKLDIDPQDARMGFAQVVGGGVHAVGRVKFDYFLVGPNRKYDMDAAVIVAAGRGDGLLGMNFLRDLKYHVDFSSQTIRWGD
jgi:predicted aspartyl protease